MAAARGDPPAVARQRVRRALRRFRDATPLSQGDVAKKLGWSLSKVQRIEGGEVGVSVTDLRALLDIYGVTDQAQIDRLSRDAQTSRRQRYETAPAHREYLTQGHRELMQFEKQAVAIRTYQPVVYPAVIQTSAIAEAVISRWTEGEEARRVRHEARLERKAQIIDRPDGPEYYVVLDEAVIKRRFAGLAATAEQLELTTQIAQLPNVHIRMVPFDRGADMVAMGSFIIVDLVGDDESAIIYRENFNKDEILDSRPDVVLHRAAFDRLWKASLTEEVTASALVAEAAALRSTLERDGER
jgi:transcriptional regulator with XRE-family HTH domain